MNIARRGDAGELETCVAWYVGEYANFLAAEYAWESAEGAETIGSETDPSSDGSARRARVADCGDGRGRFGARVGAEPTPRRRRRRDATLGVGVAAVDDQTAAIRALAVIAVRSGEPFRLGCSSRCARCNAR